MFKEFGLIFIVFVLAAVGLKRLYHRSHVLFRRAAAVGAVLAVLANVVYNLVYVFPEFIYEGVPLGDSRENLFVYKEDSQFPWQIMNTVTHNRQVSLDRAGGLYEEYFNLFARDVREIEVTQEARERLDLLKEEFLRIEYLDAVEQMPYAFPEWEGDAEHVPSLYVKVESLQGNGELVCIVNDRDDLYMMSQEYYEAMVQKEEAP